LKISSTRRCLPADKDKKIKTEQKKSILEKEKPNKAKVYSKKSNQIDLECFTDRINQIHQTVIIKSRVKI
jgi:hypothetical protein